MSNTLSKVFIFTVGAAVGSAVTWKLLKDKYEQITNEEIESVKEYYSKKYRDAVVYDPFNDTTDEAADEIDRNRHELVSDCDDLVVKEGYINYSDIKTEKKEVDHMQHDEPYVISPSEYGSLDGYDTNSFTYYADGVLADDADEALDDESIDYIVGADFADHFGEYEDDSVFIRNDFLRCDYEILADERNYSEVAQLYASLNKEE